MADERLITPEFRGMFVSVLKPREQTRDDGSVKREYSITAVYPKGEALTALKAAYVKFMEGKFGKDQDAWPEFKNNPFRKCKERHKVEKSGKSVPVGFEEGDAYFMEYTSNEKFPPEVVDRAVQPILEPRDVYSGAYYRAEVSPYYYDFKGNRGIKFGLRHVQKTRDGEAVGFRVTHATDAFEPIGDDAGGANKKKNMFEE